MDQAIRGESTEPPREHPESTEGISERERAIAQRVVIAVGIAYLIVQLVLIPRDWPAGWDESIYLSQFTPGMEGLFFRAWHARGITLIVAPITLLGGSVADVRLFLTILSAIAVTLTFRLWVPLVGLAAALAAFMFSFSWQGLLLASEVEPNFWAAILSLATAGLIARRIEAGRTRDVVLASVFLAAAALVRPTEATVLAVAIGSYILLFKWRSWRDLVPLGVGLLLGWLPWVIEMSVRFGGLRGAVREAGEGEHFQVVPVTENVLRHLAYTDRRGASASLFPGTIWWSAIVVMAAVAIIRGTTRSERTAALLCAFGALALAAEYLIFVPALAPRFLLPAYAIASLPLAIGIVSLLRRKGSWRVIGAIVLALLIPWTIWQATVTTLRTPRPGRGELAHRVGLTIRRLAEGHPCFVISQRVYPQIALTARCSGDAGHLVPSRETLQEISSGGRRVFMVRVKEAPGASILGPVEPIRFSTPRKTWYLYEVPRPPG